jgi:uncharacterized membrane protein
MRSTFPILFFSRKEKARVISVIREAEKQTSGEIRVHLERRFKGDGLAHAKEIFERLRMTDTQERNGVLILLSTGTRDFFVLGDKGIDEKVPQNFWEEITQGMSQCFKEDQFADGLTEAILKIGEKLKTYFPFKRDDSNELPDGLSYSL